MPTVNQTQVFKECMEHLKSGGCFLVAGSDNPNIMTIGWATEGILWGRPIFMIAVRLSRHTHEKLEELNEFTVCVPSDSNPLKKELAFAGAKSGRDYDKAATLGLKYIPSEKISVPGIDGCSVIYECKVIYKTEMHEAHLDQEIVQTSYLNGDYHTLYFGEILACQKF